MSSIPFRKYFSNLQTISKASFSTPYANLLLFTTNPFFTSAQAFVEVESASEYKAQFGSSDGVADLLSSYFGTINEAALAPKKAVIARFYNADTAAFSVSDEAPKSLSTITGLTYPATFTLSMGGQSTTISITSLSSATSYSNIATAIQTQIRAYTTGGTAFTSASVEFSSDINRFVIKSGVVGTDSTIDTLTDGTQGLLAALGGFSVKSQGVDEETLLEAYQRLYAANPEAFFYATTTTPTTSDITSIVEWANGVENQQSLSLDVMPVFRFATKSEAVSVGNSLKTLGYSGYLLLHDEETTLKFMMKSVGLFASFSIDVRNARMGGNFHQISGVNAVNHYDSPVDYQSGVTNELYVKALDDAYVSYPYTLGVGTQETLLFGQGATGVDGGTVGSAVAFSILDKDIKTNLANLNISVTNFPIRGTQADALVKSALTPSYVKGNTCGLLAQGATLSDSDKAVVLNAFGQKAVDSLEEKGWYFQVEERTAEDIANKQIRVSDALLDAGSADNGVKIRTVVYR